MLQVIEDYQSLEPGSSDTWNLVHDKWQLGYRLNVLTTLTRALERSGVELSKLSVLDFGCGTGRSTRAYLDLGLRPNQVTGYDLRPGAIDLARSLNPAIHWAVPDSRPLPGDSNWVSVMTLFSSVRSAEERTSLARALTDTLPPSGHLFYYDSQFTRDFAGSERIRPRALFAGLRPLWSRRVGRYDAFSVRDRLEGVLSTGAAGSATHPSLRDYVRELVRPYDEAILFRA